VKSHRLVPEKGSAETAEVAWFCDGLLWARRRRKQTFSPSRRPGRQISLVSLHLDKSTQDNRPQTAIISMAILFGGAVLELNFRRRFTSATAHCLSDLQGRMDVIFG